MKCSKRKCPMQHNTISDDCNLDDCPYRTEDVEPQEVIRALCNYIADLVVQKLKVESEDEGMSKEELRFEDDKLYAYVPLPQYGDEIYQVQLIMTKEIFQECYKKWIEPQAESEE